MTESIKQEIINNIFENGDKLITGPILQTVLIDMIDDVNVKDQAILSKTGSWDEAVTQIPNLATKAEVTNLSESVARDLENVVDVDLTGYATEQWVQNQGYLKEHQDISGLATKGELNDTKSTLESNLNNLSSSVSNDIQNKGEEVKTWVQSQGYLKEHQDISGLATKVELNAAETNLQGNITSLSESVARDIANVSVPEGVATEAWVQSQDYASKSYVDNAVSSSSVDLTGYATETWVESKGYLTEHQDISGLATKDELNSVSQSVQTDISNLATKGELNDTKNSLQGNITSLSESVARDLENVNVDLTGYATETWVQSQGYLKEHQDISGLATKTELNSVSESIQTDITNLSESVASSAVWKKGEGQDSVVQKLTGANEAKTPKATGPGSIAIGSNTLASGDYSHTEGYHTHASNWYSHAEGQSTKAIGAGSHAEGDQTTASGVGSHAEGFNTITSNYYEHAQGRYNYTSSNQIFSIGTGNSDTDRRNAVSVLEVRNNNSYTSSFFVQNVGGYDGTNPTPGTNDLATVINGLSSSGGSSETLWKKGTGTDSIVQVIADGKNLPTATGKRAIATGYATTASGDSSHAEGESTNASNFASHAEGKSTTASGQYSHAEGYATKATGNYSHAEGAESNASGYSSHAEGAYTTASGSNSHAEGKSTTASGQYSHAEGYATKALGQYSHAEGYQTSASNDYSHAEGYETKTSNECEHAQGRYNHNSENQIFSIGAGEMTPNFAVTRRNALSVLVVPNADTKINTASVFIQNVGGYDGTNPTPGTNDLATVINGMSSGGGSSSGGSSETLWKKGTGTDSIVQVLSGDNETNTPRATGTGSVATGYDTGASKNYSHAEGWMTAASGEASHAEGSHTQAIGFASHAEGWGSVASGGSSHAEGEGTIAENEYEHAQGTYNHNSENQIFSVGAGENMRGITTRRNAVSILVVPNSETQINTASFFVQNIGGYDGTNPLPGTNDLATVLNNTETWTFTLEDGSTVTKTIRIS